MPMFQEAMDGLRSLAKAVDLREQERKRREEQENRKREEFIASLPRGDGKDPNLIPTLPNPWTFRHLECGKTSFGVWMYACILFNKDTGSLSMMGSGITIRAAVLDAMKIHGLKEPN